MKLDSTPMLPNGDMEIVFSFDTTGSMHHCIDRVQDSLKEIMRRLFQDIPALKVALFAHADYCEKTHYVTKYIDFTTDIQQLFQFTTEVCPTNGGDLDECYELVLHQVRTELSWTPGSQRALVLIGDANPHSPNYPANTLKLDWKDETKRLQEMGVRIYGVNCGDRYCDEFYQYISDNTGGRKIDLKDISSVTQMLMAVCYREKGCEYFEAFEKEIRANTMTKTLSGVFDALRAEDDVMAVVSPVSGMSSYKPKKPTKVKAKRTTAPKGMTAKRKLILDKDGDEPVTKKRSSSVYSTSSESSSSESSSSTCSSKSTGSTHKMFRRSSRHPMALRKQSAAVLNGRVQKKVTKKSPRTHRPEKVNRESVISKRFLEELEWTPWYTAMAKSSLGSFWSSRPGSRTGMRNDTLFDNSKDPAIYEFAVATPGSVSKYPVCASVTSGYNNQTWEGKFLSRHHLRKQVDCVLDRNCQIYARRALVKSTDNSEGMSTAVAQLRHLLATTYDYAWQEHYNTETRMYHHRRLYKNGILISE